ncbi:mitochondrial intermediate peptidase, mitochondrial isoform X2 [Vigna radiata var. radiata]|uniref:Mitochondrial intermediate peptidase, mitochondrial isoform X2 n=1 Tax=Vigna radiata var. radiata TaxID=3916 RepID=A0A3Q0F1B8_VIGRR|nr:mitochondrial intermediate peptidase, mitochondrial isoform X2 [Vigna radiata var. radiata]
MNGAMWRVVSRASSLIFHSKKRNALSVTVRTFSAPTGLYGFPHLKTAKGFQSFVDEAIQRSGELISYICAKQPASEVMRAMDEISDTVCSVVDSAELCRHTHPDREFVEEASKASMRINEYLHYLNTNHDLYDAIKKAEQECNMLSEEAKRGVRNLRADFERGGINLCSGKLDQVNKLNIEIAQLCREYNENIVMDPGIVDIYPSSRIPRNLHYLVKPIHRSVSLITKDLSGSRGTLKEKGFRITTDPQTVSSVLQFSSDDEANVDVLKRLISARHELAQIMGCSSYTEFSIKPNMALSPKVVMSFLLEMSKMVKPKTREEHRLLTKFKREKCGQSDEDLRPWDETYYMTMMKSSAYKLDASVVGSYFSLSNCIEGLKVLVQSLFGATFHSIPLAPNESWDPHVLKLSLHHPEEGDLGYLYLDLYSRKGKYPGCAHFAIKGGRRISPTEYQLPIVALVCNFPGSQNPSAVRLNHWEVETLFHEFGHALHSLLSRTDYQHFSGTRAVLDFAEIPSNLFEYSLIFNWDLQLECQHPPVQDEKDVFRMVMWHIISCRALGYYAWDYRVLRKFARHCSTGEEIPQKLVESMQGARDMFAATELQRQIFYALVDQTLFGEQPLPHGDISSVVAELKREHTNYGHVKGTHWETRFSHLLNYGAGYYSYLYAKCFAATIWKKLCEEDPLSSTTGFALRTKFLQHGGAREPDALLNDLMGDGIYRYHDGGIVPDISCLCDEMKLVEEYPLQVHL